MLTKEHFIISGQTFYAHGQTSFSFAVSLKERKGKGSVYLLMEFHLTATACHLSYGITQCYLPPDTSEHTPPYPQPCRPVLDLPTPEG